MAAFLCWMGAALAQTNPAAKALIIRGQVSVLRDSSPWALNIGDSIQPQQIVITGPDGSALFQVADGSKFEVYPNSRVIFRANRGDWKDLLEVLLGKVKVEIEKIGGQPNYNKVRTPTAVISVRGTIFDVDVEDEDATTLVLVEEGQVEVRHLSKPGDSKVLNPGEWIRIYKNQPLAAKSVDRGALLFRAVRAASDALYDVILRGPQGGGAGQSPVPGGAGAGNGDSCKPNCSAPPPPPPPPPH
ncbi:MAG: FecR domain-containing protein [Acidobacteriota bacterium]|nr:FecR domain-containing protein [Acidobacteriota bacterium]